MGEHKDKRYYSSLGSNLLTVIPKGMKRVLDVGCGSGALGAVLKQRGVQEVVGIELNKEVAREAEKYLDQVVIGDVEQITPPFPKDYFNCIVYGDVLEHLKDPWSVLLKHKQYLNQSGYVVASIPNVRHYSVVLRLLRGRWSYQESGCLDNTHLRFFARRDIEDLFSKAGYLIEKLGRNYFPRRRDNILKRITFGPLKDFVVFQYLILAKKSGES